MTDKTTLEKILIVLILTAGLFLRFTSFGNFPFGFDQVQILEKAEEISMGNLSLVGPRTGPGSMFTGPLIYYVTSLGYFIWHSPQALLFTGVCIYIVTGLGLWYLATTYLDSDHVWMFVMIWALSPFLVQYDRVVWNPNLMMLASGLVFMPLLKVVKSQTLSWKEFFLINGGVFLGYQAHFSGLVLLPLAVISVWMFARYGRKKSSLMVVGLGLSLLPTLVFDMRNEWLNLKGLTSLLTHEVTSYGYFFWRSLATSSSIVIDGLGNLAVYGSNAALVRLLGLGFLIGFFRYLTGIQKSQAWLSWWWIVMVVVGFSFYRGSLPPYYFLVLMPVMIWVVIIVLSGLVMSRKKMVMGAVMLGLYSLFLAQQAYFSPSDGLNLNNQQQIVGFLQVQSKNGRPIGSLVYDMREVDAIGLKYLARKIPLSTPGSIVHLGYPFEPGTKAVGRYGAIAYWVDPRIHSDNHYLEVGNLVIGSEADVQLWQDGYQELERGTKYVYAVMQEGSVIGRLTLYNRRETDRQFDLIESEMSRLGEVHQQIERVGDWVRFDLQTNYWYSRKSDWIMIYQSESGNSEALTKIKFYDGTEWLLKS